MVKKIDMDTYKRKALFEAFIKRDVPYFSVTSQVAINGLKEFADRSGCGFFVPMSFFISKAVNRVPELRHRIRNGELFEYDRVDPSYTVLMDDGTFSFCGSRYSENFEEYRRDAVSRIAAVKECPDLRTGDKNHMFFLTDVPWFSFTSIVHPYWEEYCSIPAIAVGKYFRQGDDLVAPIGIQAHHAVVDGIHAAAFYEHLSTMCRNPDAWLE